MNRRILVSVFSALFAIFLVLGNPSQSHFMRTVSNDYGSFHKGMDLSPEQLGKMGTIRYRSYLVFSSFEYKFGNISVSYFGLAFMTFYRGSSISGDGAGEPTQMI